MVVVGKLLFVERPFGSNSNGDVLNRIQTRGISKDRIVDDIVGSWARYRTDID